MQRCLQLAKLGEEYVAPNPMVGCVIVYKNVIVAEGYHKKFGDPHAEVVAFSNLSAELNVSECDVYVSLEPCSHYGKTPPCADLIIAKKPRNVYVGMMDPNPKVAGTGISKIKKAGINVVVGLLRESCEELNKKFITYHDKNRPFVTLKWAQTSDGFIGRHASESKLSKQISNLNNKFLVHQLRATHMAIMVGSNTINTDNPELNLRYWSGTNPHRIIVSKLLSVDTNMGCFKNGKWLILNNIKQEIQGNIEFVKLEDFSPKGILSSLYSLGMQSVLIEGGSQLINHFIKEQVWDEVIVIRSKKQWFNGILAPKFQKKTSYTKKQFTDTVDYYKN